MWDYLTARKRTGQAHGLSEHFPHRPKDALVVYCLACPEWGVNLKPGWEKTPPYLRHLTQLRLTSDGNHQCNQYAKNSDPDDVSLYQGRSYYGDEDHYLKYLKECPNKVEV